MMASMSHCAYVEVRRQLVRIGSLLPSSESWGIKLRLSNLALLLFLIYRAGSSPSLQVLSPWRYKKRN